MSTGTLRIHEALAEGFNASASRTRHPNPLAIPNLARETVLILALLLLNAAGTVGAVAFFSILLIMVLRSPEAAFKAIAICYLGLMINQAFVPKTLVWTPGRLIVPYVALIRFTSDMAALKKSLFTRSSYIAFLFFAAVMAICSVLSGWFTQIALLKLANFVCFYTAVMSAVIVLRARRSDLGEWVMSLVIAATLIGTAAVAFGVSSNFRPIAIAPGRLLSAPGFNGAFLHPNSHATYAAVFVAFLATVWLLSTYRRVWLAVPLLACWFVFMVWSASRTSLIASLSAVALLIMYARPTQNRLGWRLRPNLNRMTIVIIGGVAGIGLLIFDGATGNKITKSVITFINKSELEELNTDTIISSRKQIIEYSLQNFRENPVFGIGFGVAKTEGFRRTATLFSAPAEKGFLPTAILEEGGVLGALAFCFFLLTFLWELRREGNLAGLIMFLTFLITNIGEVTIFAPGGGGAFGWTMVGAGMILGDRCWVPPPFRPHRHPTIETTTA